MMDRTWRRLITWAIKTQEGGLVYTDHPSDLGGPTFAGVSFHWFYRWTVNTKGDEAIHNKEDALDWFKELAQIKDTEFIDLIYEFYYAEFIKPLQLDRIHPHLHKPLFSCAINIDPRDCIRLLQSTLNKNATISNTLLIDGIIGVYTITKLQDYIEITSDTNFHKEQCRRLTNSFCHLWMLHYANLVKKVPRQADNLKGWTNRVFKFVE